LIGDCYDAGQAVPLVRRSATTGLYVAAYGASPTTRRPLYSLFPAICKHKMGLGPPRCEYLSGPAEPALLLANLDALPCRAWKSARLAKMTSTRSFRW
jgi:hypothetical protein